MNKIEWCLKQKRGIRLIEQNEILSKDYIRKSEEALDSMAQLKNKNWKLITGYYACYNALYSLLIKCGIKSEIHDCTIALASLFDYFADTDLKLITNLKEKRIDVQYYLKEAESIDEKGVKDFVIKVKKLLSELTEENIEKIRTEIKK